MFRRAHRVVLAVTVVASVAMVGSVAYGVTGIGHDKVINGCYKSSNGGLRVIDPPADSCHRSETPISWNRTGPQGPKGDPGPSGQPGGPGPTGPRGPSDAFADRFGQVAVPATGSAQPYSRTLAPGSYVFTATFRAIAHEGATNAECELVAGAQVMDTKNIDLDGNDDRKVVTLLATRTLTEPTRIRLDCGVTFGAAYAISHGQVVALQVAEIH
jgi:hypothetical protein